MAAGRFITLPAQCAYAVSSPAQHRTTSTTATTPPNAPQPGIILNTP